MEYDAIGGRVKNYMVKSLLEVDEVWLGIKNQLREIHDIPKWSKIKNASK